SDLDLAISHGAGGHIDYDGRLFVAWESDGDGIRTKHSLCAPQRSHELGGVGHGPADEISLKSFQRIIARDSKMVRIANAHPTRAELFCLFHSDLIRLGADNQTQTIVPIDSCHAGFFSDDSYIGLGIDSAQLQHIEVSVQPRYAVGIDAS